MTTQTTAKHDANPAAIAMLEARLRDFRPGTRHEFFVKSALLEALVALYEGNYGIGAVIVRKNRIIARGHNRLFVPYFDSGHHAEMDVMGIHELRMASRGPRVDGCTLYTTLEPCPMCYTRLLSSGIKTVYYAAEDQAAGMITLMEHLKADFRSLWRDLATSDNRRFEAAPIRPTLSQLSWDMFVTTKSERDADLVALGGGCNKAEEFMLSHLKALPCTSGGHS
jgi:cytosine deaminase